MPHTIILEVRAAGRTLSLLFSVERGITRLHLLSQRYPNPAAPPAFCQFLRAHLQGARIEELEQVAGDRIVRLRMIAREGPCSFLAELTGRSANLLLLDAENKVLAALSGARLQAGQPYSPPAGGSDPQRRGREQAGPQAIDDMTAADPPASIELPPFPVSATIERRYLEREAELAHTHARDARLADVRRHLQKTTRRIQALRQDLDKAAKYQHHARYGELLKTNLGCMAKGQDQVTVIDYFDPATPELVIPLDPAKSPKGNLDDYFTKHRKFLAAEREIRPRLTEAEREQDRLRADLAAVQQDTWQPPIGLPAGSSRTGLRPVRRERNATPARRGPFRRFTSADGLPIYVGRNARENEELTFGLARSDDLWLHARGTPGSHVVVRLEKGADPLPDTIKDAATLALLYSDLKKGGKGDVIYTRRKWVRKVKGQTPGTVTVTQEKTIFVTLDRVRLDRLKGSSP